MIVQLHENVGLLAVLCSATNIVLGTVAISRYIKNISLNAEIIRTVHSGPVAIAEVDEKSLDMAARNSEQQNRGETTCVIARLIKSSPVRKTFVRVVTSAGKIHLAKTCGNLAETHQALAAPGIVDTVQRFLSTLKRKTRWTCIYSSPRVWMSPRVYESHHCGLYPPRKKMRSTMFIPSKLTKLLIASKK